MDTEDEFITEEDYDFEKPKSKGIFGVFSRQPKPKSDRIQLRSKKMPDGIDLSTILGGSSGTREDQNRVLDYQPTNYVPLADTYKPLEDTYQKLQYQPSVYKKLEYQSPPYESMRGVLLGEQGKAWEESSIFKDTGIGDMLFKAKTEESMAFKPTGMSEVLFGMKGQVPILNAESASPETFPMQLPSAEKMPYIRATLPVSLQPSPSVEVHPTQQTTQPSIQEVPVVETEMAETVVEQPVKRPVGRPRVIRPERIKRPVGRPRGSKNRSRIQEAQMATVQ